MIIDDDFTVPELYVRDQCPRLEVRRAKLSPVPWVLIFDGTDSRSASINAMTQEEMWQRAFESLRRREATT